MSTSVPALRKLDYLSFTLPDGTSHSEIYSLLSLKFQELGFGRYRYKQSAVASAGGVSVFWDGAVEGMGVHVQISGTGCRIIESLDDFCSWRDYIKAWFERGAKVSRIDIALDDESGAIAFQTVHDQVRTRTAVMRSSYSQLTESTTKKGTSQTLYVGRRSSETLMRCYDKGMQKGEGRNWLRFEFEYKGKRADALARLLVNEGWDAAVGVARSFIEFKDENDLDPNRTRRRPADWWVQLISASKHVLCVSREAHESLVKSWTWLKRQVAPMLGVMMKHEVGDLAWFLDLVDDGCARHNERHRRLLQAEGNLPTRAAVVA